MLLVQLGTVPNTKHRSVEEHLLRNQCSTIASPPAASSTLGRPLRLFNRVTPVTVLKLSLLGVCDNQTGLKRDRRVSNAAASNLVVIIKAL